MYALLLRTNMMNVANSGLPAHETLMRGRVAINLLRGFCFRDFEQSHPSCFTPGEVESLRCEITVRCVGAGVCGFDGDVQ